MNLLRQFGVWLGRYYDRLLTALALAALVGAIVWGVIGLGKLAVGQQSFNAMMSGMTPDHPEAQLADLMPYERGLGALEAPPQFSSWSNTLFVPETRCYCIDCRRPIPMDAMTCPFCGIGQPDIVTNNAARDFDFDGMPDAWERQYAFDYRNRDDAALDADGDGWTNLEEYTFEQTDPTSAGSHPPYGHKVVISAVEQVPFRLLFKSVITLADGSKQFAINTQQKIPRTYFVKMGQPVGNEGFVVHGYEEKFVERDQGGVKMRVNASVLTLRSGRTLIPLTYGQQRSYVEYHAKLLFVQDNLEFPARVGEPMDLRGESYKVMTVDIPKETVVIQRLSDGKRFEVHKAAAQPIPAVEPVLTNE